jgi:Ca2+-transporting ATPase
MIDDAYARPVDDVVATLATDPDSGLTASEAARRLGEVGPNQLSSSQGPTRFQLLLRQFSDPMVWLLVVAAGVSGALLGEWIDAGVILAIVILNAVIGYRQESRAEEALASLKQLSAPTAVVVRDGAESTVPAADLVPGDVIVLETGDRVPADARLVFVSHLRVDESLLTGESMAVEKDLRIVPAGAAVGDRSCMVFAGSAVAVGRGRGVVVETGMETEVGEIAALLDDEEPPTPLEVELARVGRRIGYLVVVIAAAIFGVGVLREFPPEAMFLTAVALAVAAIPEGLPAVVTITLSRGVQRMADARAIVRRLTAVEALGAASIICTDKTGTLTKNEMAVQAVAFVDRTVDDRHDLAADRRGEVLATIAALCNDARIVEGERLGDPTEVALAEMAGYVIDVDARRVELPRLDEAAFDSTRKRMSTLHGGGAGTFLAVKGAPEVLLPRCTEVEGPVGRRLITREEAESIAATVAGFAERGLRTLALARRDLTGGPSMVDPDMERDLVLIGVVAMSDEIRDEAFVAVEEAASAGIRVVMVTGDHEVTARSVATQLGISGEVMGGGELRTIESWDLDVERYGVFARVDPADKVKLVKAWQSRGGIVAMTGDGVNDAPALNVADIGVAMGSGTDVAKEASSMVLSDDNFATIVNAVREGRGIYANLRKVVSFLLSANISEVFVMLIGFLLLGAEGEPLLATQLLWVNLVTDGLPALGLGVDRAGNDLMRLPPDPTRSMLSVRRQLDLLWQGAVLAAGVLATYWWGVGQGLEWETVRTIGFTALVVTQLLHVWNVRALTTGPFGTPLGGNRLLLWGVLVSLVLHVLVVYTPLGQTLFETTPLGALEWLVAVAAGAGSFATVALVKWAKRARA